MYKKLFSLAVASVLLTGCESDTGTTPIHDPRTPLAISAGVTTRATDALWHANDAIGIYTLKGGTVYDQQANYRYINNAGEGASATFAPADAANTAYFPEDGSELDVIAYYPYQQSTGGEGILTIEVSDQSSLPKIDLMTSALSTGHSKEKVDVALQFRHRLAKLVMVLKSDETTADIDLAGATITLQGTATQGTYHLMEQQITEATAIADIALVGRTAIVMPTEAGKGVSFTVTAGDKEFNATMPDPIALAAGKVTTVAITLQTLNSGDTQAAISATITDWEGGPTAEMDAIRFVAPVNPETGAPEINRFTVMKNGASPTLYEYVDGAWSASPAFFLVEETTAEDEFTATAEGETDKISKLKDLLTAGPATMNSAGIIELPFEHSMAKLTINLHEGEGFTGNPANAKVTYEEISYFGNGKTFIIHPKEYAAGAVIAIVEIGGYSYEAVAKEAISFAKGTVNKLAITLKVEEQGNRIAAMRVTDKPWEIGTQSTATAIHFVPPTSPITHSPDVATFTVMKNGEEPTLYTFTSGLWSASPAFFMVEETLADDRFTATATGIADPITGITDDLAAPEAAMNSEGIIHLEFEHVKAMLTVTLTKGIDFPAAIDLNKAVVELKEFPGKTVTGVNNTFIVEPTTTDIAKGTEVASITVGGITYQATLAEPLKLEKGKKTLLTIALSPTDTGISVTLSEWGEGTTNSATAINIITPENSNSGDLSTFKLWKSGKGEDKRTYTFTDGAWMATNPFYIEDAVATDRYYARHIPAAADQQAPDILIVNDVAMNNYTLPLLFEHAMSKLTLRFSPGEGYSAYDLEDALLTISLKDYANIDDENKITVSEQATEKSLTAGSYLFVPRNYGNLKVNVTVGNNSYSGTISNLILSAGKESSLTLTINKTGVGISSSVSVSDWDKGEETGGELELQ